MDIMWRSLDLFCVEQAEIAVDNKTIMSERNKSLRVFENMMGPPSSDSPSLV